MFEYLFFHKYNLKIGLKYNLKYSETQYLEFQYKRKLIYRHFDTETIEGTDDFLRLYFPPKRFFFPELSTHAYLEFSPTYSAGSH